MLTLSDVTVTYGRVAAVQSLSLRVDEGELVALVGHNGAGKSTTMMAITGVHPPVAGDIQLDGRSILKAAPERIARSGLALVPENRRIFGRLTVGENLLVGTTGRRDRREANRHLAQMLERFPVLGECFDTSAAKLSGGEQQQLAIARALLAKPKVLLLDEPSLGLAPLIVEQLFALLLELKAEGVTILCAEQEVAKLIEVADRAYVLRAGGRVEFQGTTDELRAMPNFESWYVGFRAGTSGAVEVTND